MLEQVIEAEEQGIEVFEQEMEVMECIWVEAEPVFLESLTQETSLD